MAFAFFRRRQKMVIIVMAVLMVSFLVGFQGFDMLFSRGGDEKAAVGKVRGEEIRRSDLTSAASDLVFLEDYLRLNDPLKFGNPYTQELLFLQQDPANRNLGYALLLHEAQKSGLRVTDNEIEDFLAQLGFSGARRKLLLDELRNNRLAEKQLQAAVGRFLLIHKNAMASVPTTPPTEPELRRLYADLAEQLTVRVVKIPAEQFLKNVPDPGPTEVANQFQMYKAFAPGNYPNAASFGFGYFQPPKVKIAYLRINGTPILRALQPDDKSVRDYYRTNQAEFVREVPVEASSKPASAPAASEPSTQPVEYRTEQMDFASAKPLIVEKLTADAAIAKMDELAKKAEDLRKDAGKSGSEIYETIAGKMRLPAEEILNRKIDVRIEGQRLDRAMVLLAEAARLNAIVYPYGGQGQQKVDPGVRVSLVVTGVTLRGALDEITAQLNLGKDLRWACCLGMEGTLFPVDVPLAEGFFPVTAGATKLVEYSTLEKGSSLGSVTESPEGGRALPAVAFVSVFGGGDKGPSLQPGMDGQRMYGRGKNACRILWRLVSAVPAHEPIDLTDEIRDQVVKDLRTKAAFDKASALAEEVKKMADKMGLEEAARSHNLEFDRVETLTRKFLTMPARQLLELARQYGMGLVAQAAVAPPFEFEWRTVPDLRLPTPDLRQNLIEKVFELVPAEPGAATSLPASKPATATAPASKPAASQPVRAHAVEMVSLPSIQAVAVLERVGYRPPVIGEFQEGNPNMYPPVNRDFLGQAVFTMQRWNFIRKWFTVSEIEKRTGYEGVAK